MLKMNWTSIVLIKTHVLITFALFFFLSSCSVDMEASGKVDTYRKFQGLNRSPWWEGKETFTWERSYATYIRRLLDLESKNILLIKGEPFLSGGESYSLYKIVINPTEQKTGRKKLLITSGVHGDEKSGPQAILTWLEMVSQNPALCKERVEIIPVVNPWGFEYGCRYNPEGYDINRDFNLFVTPESRAVVHLIHGNKYNTRVDLHEASCNGSFVYSYRMGSTRKAKQLLKYLAENHFLLEKEYVSPKLFDEPGLVKVSGLQILGSRLIKRVPLGYYGSSTFSEATYTFETGKYLPDDEAISAQLKTIEFFTMD